MFPASVASSDAPAARDPTPESSWDDLVAHPHQTVIEPLDPRQTKARNVGVADGIGSTHEGSWCLPAHQHRLEQNAHLVQEPGAQERSAERATAVDAHRLHAEALVEKLEGGSQVDAIAARRQRRHTLSGEPLARLDRGGGRDESDGVAPVLLLAKPVPRSEAATTVDDNEQRPLAEFLGGRRPRIVFGRPGPSISVSAPVRMASSSNPAASV